MRSLAGIVMFVGLLTCLGCITHSDRQPDLKSPPPPVPVGPPPVTPDMATSANARQIVQALAEEMDREQYHALPGAVSQ